MSDERAQRARRALLPEQVAREEQRCVDEMEGALNVAEVALQRYREAHDEMETAMSGIESAMDQVEEVADELKQRAETLESLVCQGMLSANEPATLEQVLATVKDRLNEVCNCLGIVR